MTRTRELAEKLATISDPDEVERALLVHFAKTEEGQYPDKKEAPARAAAYDKATILGFFWAKCITCGEWFAGFEWGGNSVMLENHTGIGVCNSPRCVEDAKRITKLWPHGIHDPDIPADAPTHIINRTVKP
jgi:hypothetical protein